MIKHYIRLAIIILIQILLPILILSLIAPWVIKTHSLSQWQYTLADSQPFSLILHGVFYLGLLWLWPQLVMRLHTQNQLATEQLNAVIRARWYLLAIFLLIDALTLLRTA